MRRLLIISMSFIILALIFTGCEEAGESGSSITQSEAEAGIEEVGATIEKAMNSVEANPQPEGITVEMDSSTATYIFDNVSYDDSTIDGTIEMTIGGTQDSSEASMSFDNLTVDSITVDGSLDIKGTVIDETTSETEITGTITITGGSISSLSYDIKVTNETVTGTITVNGKSFDADVFSEDNLPAM